MTTLLRWVLTRDRCLYHIGLPLRAVLPERLQARGAAFWDVVDAEQLVSCAAQAAGRIPTPLRDMSGEKRPPSHRSSHESQEPFAGNFSILAQATSSSATISK